MIHRLVALIVAVVAFTATATFAAPRAPASQVSASHRAAPAAPYHPPPFAKACHFRHFGEAKQPPATGYKDDPLCVDYAKRDITVDNGGAARFALAEPARFAIATRACRYWQTDHWSVQVDRGFTAAVRWDGSYWFDRGRGTGAVLTRHFRVAGQRVGAAQAAALVRTVSPDLARQINRYGAGSHGAGGGMSFSLGGGDPTCQS